MAKKEIKYAVQMQNITMNFGAFKALDNVDLNVIEGEVHALIGENGAGKSTLMSILFGLYNQTKGSILINGEMVQIDSPLKANKYGIGMVHQHFKLVETFSVLDNIILNDEETKYGFIKRDKARIKVEKIMEKYNFLIDLDMQVSKCSVAEQQRVEILKMLYKDADILIFDEPTAVLAPQQITEFLKAIKNLQKKGKTIIIITHKLDELKQVAQRGTIIRRGKFIDVVDIKKITQSQLGKKMVGASVVAALNKHKKIKEDNPIIKINNLTVNSSSKKDIIALDDFSIEIKPGEILAIAGVEGNGQTELINAITGMQKVKSGQIEVWTIDEKSLKTLPEGEPVPYHYVDITSASILKRYQLGMAHIPEDRHKHGVVLDMNMIENFALQDHRKDEYSKLGFIKNKSIKDATDVVVKDFDVRSSEGVTSALRGLSGGNQQKFIVGRELAKVDSTFIVIAQPTRGLDVGAITNIHSYILKAKEAGKAILLVSYELEEIIALADRIVVLNSGKKVGELSAKGVTKNKLGALMTKTKTSGGEKNG